MKVKYPLILGLSLLATSCNVEDFTQMEVVGDVVGSCSQTGKNREMAAFMYESYLWNDDIPANINPSQYSSLDALLNAMKRPDDQFSFLLTEQEYIDRYVNAVYYGFGFSSNNRTDLDVIEIRYVYDGSPAGQAGLNRGDRIIEVDGVSIEEWFNRISQGTASNSDIFGPNELGIEKDIVWRTPDGQVLSAIMSKEEVETNTVMHTQREQVGDVEVGYFVFDTFINRSAQDLNTAYDQLDGVDELVIDLRYNSGGLIRIANQLSSQAAWNSVQNEIFVTYRYNDNFQPNSILFDLGEGITRLNVDKVYVLTTPSSCSSSELVINSLRPFVDVVTIGDRTCGKPVGQSPRQFCDEILFSINFETVNAVGQGGYFDGIAPDCSAPDTIVGDWGDNNDPLLSTAYHYIENGSCPATATTSTTDWQPMQRNPLLDKFESEH
ncbi:MULTISPECIES: S41 family peptidase [Gammaproteobacteria]|uniref:S41 family peptidase n=1 Tax=Gammaproteobacteria TaxID=1236 RepID=UPI000DD01FCA|nr:MULTISPECIES: S41 family peptidase [Gammaproteobacteria]RTE87413.1 carboxyl-terminal protease [Aliidiomarina sp. B3213]TCZ92801.1 carboxyl-terminal protease [Lysobacter sp. N42]